MEILIGLVLAGLVVTVFSALGRYPGAEVRGALGDGALTPRNPPGAREDPLEALARELGLEVGTFDRLVGRRLGFEVQLIRGERAGPWTVQITLDFLMPSGAEVRWGAGRESRGVPFVEGPTDDLRWLVEAPAVQDALEPLLDWSPVLSGQLRMSVPKDALDRALSAGATLCKALAARRRAPVTTILARLGAFASADTAAEAEGTLDGFEVRVALPWVAGACWRASIQVPLSGVLPPTTVLSAAGAGSGPSVPLGDLILDKALHVHTDAPERARPALVRDSVRGPLLDLLCTHPASEVSDRRIEAVFTEGVLDIDARLDEVLALARGLCR